MQALETGRQLEALWKVEARERQALEVKRVREQFISERNGHDPMPALEFLELNRRSGEWRASNNLASLHDDQAVAEHWSGQVLPLPFHGGRPSRFTHRLWIAHGRFCDAKLAPYPVI